MDTGKLIKELRTRKGMTQEELADKTEISSRTIQRIENGEVDARAYTLQAIAKVLNVDFNLFLENKSDQSNEVKKISDSNWIGLVHLSGMLPLFFPTVLIWSYKKDKIKGIAEHYRLVISFQLIVLGVIIGSLWVYWRSAHLMPLFGVMLVSCLYSVFKAMVVMSGKPYDLNKFIPGSLNNKAVDKES